MGIALVLAVFIGVLGLIVAAARSAAATAQSERTTVLERLGSHLEAPLVSASQGVLSGKHQGISVQVAYVTRGSGSYSESWTEVTVSTPRNGLVLELRPQTSSEESALASGLAVDVQLGDDEFDRAFVVEAAPADVVRALLDKPLKKRILALRPIEVLQTPIGIKICKKTWISELSALEELMDVATTISSRADQAFGDVRAALQATPSVAGSYRENAIANTVQTTERRHEAETRDVLRTRERRSTEKAAQDRALLWVVAILVGGVLFAVVASSLSGGSGETPDRVQERPDP